jgi:predicted DNA-binding protein (MmcQ/YjbR family)
MTGHPPRPVKPAVLARIRKLCLALPGTSEKEAWGAPTFRVRDRMFATFVTDHHGDGRTSVWVNAPLDAQRVAVKDDPENIFIPPYVGKKGWIGVRLDRGIDWKTVSAFLAQAHRWTAPPLAERAPRKR